MWQNYDDNELLFIWLCLNIGYTNCFVKKNSVSLDNEHTLFNTHIENSEECSSRYIPNLQKAGLYAGLYIL